MIVIAFIIAFIGVGYLVGATGLRHDQHLLVLFCCFVHERGVCVCVCVCFFFCIAPRVTGVYFFSCFFVAPRGLKAPRNLFQKTPQGVFLHLRNRSAPGAFTRIKVFPHTEPPKNPGNSIFQLFRKKKLFFLIGGSKSVIGGGGHFFSSPGGPCTALSTSIRFVQAFGQSFSAIFDLYY